ncbi:hypothetical protein D1007_58869 [Hordeum vulgare]|nr:hypothetical protein D1007_58869 [Hordeum vulgare]
MPDLLAGAAFGRSARRPWVLTDSKCQIGDRDNATTAHGVTTDGRDIKVTFELADPPGVSRCFVHCPGLGLADSRYAGDPMVVSSTDAFVLLVVPFTGASRPRPGAPSLWRRPRGSQFNRCGEYYDFFVYMAGPGVPSLRLLPITHGSEPLCGSGTTWCPRTPIPSDTCNEKGVIGQGWTISTWNRGICSKKWDKKFTAKADNVHVTDSCYPKVSGGKRFSWDKVVHGGPTLSLCDDDVVYIMARLDIRPAVAWMLAINIRKGILEAVKQCSAEKMHGLEPTYIQCALSNYVKQWRR